MDFFGNRINKKSDTIGKLKDDTIYVLDIIHGNFQYKLLKHGLDNKKKDDEHNEKHLSLTNDLK